MILRRSSPEWSEAYSGTNAIAVTSITRRRAYRAILSIMTAFGLRRRLLWEHDACRARDYSSSADLPTFLVPAGRGSLRGALR